jgi:NADH-quinone oxidoreductase subunit L
LYAWLVQVPGKGFGRVLATLDERAIDGAVNGAGAEVRQASRIAPIIQRGFVRSYALAFLLGVAALMLFLAVRF